MAGGTNTGLDGLVSIAASTDGLNVYAAATIGDAMATFDHNASTGALTWVPMGMSFSGTTAPTPTPSLRLASEHQRSKPGSAASKASARTRSWPP